MPNANLENKTPKLFPKKAAVVLSKKHRSGIITEYATRIKDPTLLKLPSEETIQHPQELLKIMKL